MSSNSLQIQSVMYHNERPSLDRALLSLANAIQVNKDTAKNIGHVIVVYGDASSSPMLNDNDITLLQETFSESFEFRYVFFDENTGSAKGHNLLGDNCEQDYMMVMNPDVIVAPDFFEPVFEAFERPELNTGLVEARQTPIEHPKKYSNTTGETSWAATACVVFPTEIFKELHGFDSDSFFMYCDDVDFSWQIRLLGKSIIYQPLALAFHAKRLTAEGKWCPTEAEKYYSAEAALMLNYKWSNDARCSFLLEQFKRSPEEYFRKAAQVFLDRKNQGKLPKQLDKAHKVSTFTNDDYTKHRFLL